MFNRKFNIETGNNEIILFKTPSIATKIFKLPNLYTIVTNKHIYNMGFFKEHKMAYKSIQAINIKKGKFYYQLLIMPSKKNKIIKFRSNKKAVFALFNIISNNLMQPNGSNLNNFNMNKIINENNDKKDNKKENTKNNFTNKNAQIKNIDKKLILRNDAQHNKNFSNPTSVKYNSYNSNISNINILKKIINNYQNIIFDSKNYFKAQILLQNLYKNSQKNLKTIKIKFTEKKNILNAVDYNQIIINLSNFITTKNFGELNKNISLIKNKSLMKIKYFKYHIIITSKMLFDKKQLLIVKNNRSFILKTALDFNITDLNYLIFNNKNIKNKEQQNEIKQNKNYLYKMHIFNVRRIRENTKRIDILDYSEPTYLKEQINYRDYSFKIK
ncbi:MAG: hypothetical protein ACP5RQ_01260 [Candidatus Micrarchaeia archaeon]